MPAALLITLHDPIALANAIIIIEQTSVRVYRYAKARENGILAICYKGGAIDAMQRDVTRSNAAGSSILERVGRALFLALINFTRSHANEILYSIRQKSGPRSFRHALPRACNRTCVGSAQLIRADVCEFFQWIHTRARVENEEEEEKKGKLGRGRKGFARGKKKTFDFMSERYEHGTYIYSR